MAQGVRFGGCTINFSQRTLVRDGRPVPIAPLAFDCIAYLIRHRDRAVGRDELVAAVWGKVSVSDAALGKTILTARRAVGDDGESQRCIRTVPRFGYRWTAETQEFDEAGDDSAAVPPASAAAAVPAVPAAQEPPPSPHRPRWPLAAAALAALVLLAALAYAGLRHAGAPAGAAVAAADRPAGVIAVLPADVMAAADDGWLRLGLMDMIATRLSGAGLPVLPSDNVVRWVPAGTGRDEAIAILRRATERSRLVVPAVRRSGPQWIVRAELIEADGRSEAVEAESDSVIAAAAEAADRLLERLGRPAPGKALDGAGLSRAELLQRIDAARLARQPEQALALIAAAAPDAQAEPALRLRKAQIALDLGRIEPARAQLAALAASVPAESAPDLLADVQRSLCIALTQLGRADEALAACDASAGLLEGRGTPSELARTYNNRGVVRLVRQEYDLAGQDFARAKIAANLAVDRLLLAQIEGNESNMQSLQGHFAEVVATQERIGRRFEQFGMIDEYVKSLINRTSAWISLLHPAEALEASSLAMAELPRVEHAGTRIQAYLARANALELAGRFGEERVLLDRAVGEAADPSLTFERGIARAGLARVELASGAADAALPLARQALADLATPLASGHRAGAWLTVVRSLDALRRGDEAQADAQAFADWAAAGGDPSNELLARLAGAEQAAAAGRADAAAAGYAAALDLARRWSARDLLREVVVSYGQFLLARGDLPQASAIIGQIAGQAGSDFEAALLQARLYRALGQDAAAEAALEQARRLAGDRAIPAGLIARAALAGPRSSSGNGAEMPPQ